jgi:long-chain acyl-CoA synthetase
MTRETLLDFLESIAESGKPFLVYDDGFRSYVRTYREMAGAARAFAARLQSAGFGKGDKVVIWSENRPEWVVAFWGCLLAGVVVVPIDYRASREFLDRVREKVGARLVITGEEVEAIEGWRLSALDWTAAGAPLTAHAAKDDLAEIIFTSGATAEPKGVLITHRNILANIVPVEREVLKYRKYARPFSPIRFLNLLPLSHMFGQALATFIPPMLEGITVFVRGYNPEEIVRQIRTRRISVLVSVPKMLEILREYVERLHPEVLEKPPPGEHWSRRWWRYRAVHSLFGWKFWAVIVGAAPLPPDLEEFWGRLGFVVIQGYGLTETAPIVTLNHPFHARKGTVGTPIGGVEVRIADDGEVLVRGENVTQGYYGVTGDEGGMFKDGWLHTGDIGELDAEGRLLIRGRKKEMIVTPEGLNVFPEDVESVLNRQPGVKDSAVVGRDRVHAVVVLEEGADERAIVRGANAELEDHQKIRNLSRWTGGELPRTEGTRKLKRGEIARWVESGEQPVPVAERGGPALDVLQRYAGGKSVSPETTIAELGLSSLERVELMMELNVAENAFTGARTVGELAAAARGAAPGAPVTIEFPRWNRSRWARWIRNASLATWILPIGRIFAWVRVSGRENLRDIQAPVIFAPNHQSHLDVPAILMALPYRWRTRVAPAMSKEFFDAHFHPERYSRWQWFTNSLNYYLSTMFFNAFPIPQREAGALDALRYAGELAAEGWCVLIFPEGKRTDRGEIYPFQPGVAMMSSRLSVPVVPVRIEGLEKVLHQTWKMAKPGRVRVSFGKPMRLEGEDFRGLAAQIEQAVRKLGATS